MSRKYFGTDGVRGTVGESPMTPEFVLRLGYAAGRVLSGQSKDPAVVIGKDTRISGYMIESALEARLSAAGVISASHNPYADNGIKFFSADGFKLPDETEAAIEAEMEKAMGCNASAQLGKVRRREDAG